jgi:phosphoglucosamine mutase
MKKKYFGTDGIRAASNSSKLNGLTMMRLGMSLGKLFTKGDHRHRVVIGKDTRLSGYTIEQSITSGLLSMGLDVLLLGPIPTPGVAMLAKSMRADLGIMISASHNSYLDNGIKIFDKNGNKLSDKIELDLESLMDSNIEEHLVSPEKMGRAKRLEDANARYIEFQKNTFPKKLNLEGLKIVLDCANGAAYKSAPIILWELGAEVISMGVNPNGLNINHECGSTHPENMAMRVVEEKADIGICLDGDGDRIIICDEKGKIIDGDQILGLLALHWKKFNQLSTDSIVATSMSNFGLEEILNKNNIKLYRADVGDRHVKEMMLDVDANVGGEQSGHIILRDFIATGDGMITALQVLRIIIEKKQLPSKTLNVFEPLPQKLLNFDISDGSILQENKTKQMINNCKDMLGNEGRIFARMSGTESLLRVMIECKNPSILDKVIQEVDSFFIKL